MQSDGRRATVLVVDDSAPVRKTAERILRRAGYAVLMAGDGAEALERLRGGARVDLVVSDIDMPRLDGRGLAARLAAERPALPVLLCTGSGDPPGPGETILPKPFYPAELLDRVARLLGTAPAPL